MSWDPSITQRVRKAIGNSTDRTLVTDVLERGIKECETEIEHLRKRVKMLEDANRERVTESGVIRIVTASHIKEKVNYLTWVVRGAIIPVAGACIAYLWEHFKK